MKGFNVNPLSVILHMALPTHQSENLTLWKSQGFKRVRDCLWFLML